MDDPRANDPALQSAGPWLAALHRLGAVVDGAHGLERGLALAADTLVAGGVPFVLVFAPVAVGGALVYGRAGAVVVTSGAALAALDPREGDVPLSALPPDVCAVLEGPARRCTSARLVAFEGRDGPRVLLGVPTALEADATFLTFLALAAREISRLRSATSRPGAVPTLAPTAQPRRDLMEAPVAIGLLHGPEHRLVLASSVFATLFARELPLGARFVDLFPDLAAGCAPLLDRALASGTPVAANELRIVVGERTVFVNLTGAAHHDDEGRVTGIVLAATDVTASVTARLDVERLVALLQKGEARLQQVLVAAEAGTWELDLFTGRERGDTRYRELMGLPVLGDLPNDLQAIHPEDRDRVRAAEARALDRLEGLLVEFRPAAFPTRWIELRGEMMQGSDRRSAKLVGILLDVTRRKQDEAIRAELLEATAQAKRAFERLGETVPQQVWTARPDGLLDYVNGRMTAYFGLEADALVTAGWTALVHPEDVTPVKARWEHSLTTGEPYDVEFRLRGADGTYRWHLTRAVPFRDDRGDVAKWFGTNTDIEELKRAREELERRTSYEQHLIGIVSHDLRAPLHSIGLATDLLAAVPGLPPAAARPLRVVTSSAQRAARLVRDILDFTRARLTGGLPIETKPSNLRDLLEPAVREAIDAFPERHVELRVEGDLGGLWDGDRIRQVLQNALTNALRYSPAGTVVSLSARGSATEVELAVTNGGAPIAPEVLRRVFEPMTRGEESTSEGGRGHQGVGLGLFIVREIVAAHGGVVRLTSDAEHGTRLVVTLPRRNID